MNRLLFALGVATACLAGCCEQPARVRFVPTATVRRAEVQPSSHEDFRAAERAGDAVAATGNGAAWGMDDRLIQLRRGERLRVLSVNAGSGRIVVRRLDEHTLATVEPEAVEVLTTDYP